MSAQPSRVTLAVEGMSCGGCAATVARILQKAPGVISADVSFERGQAVVEYEPELTSPASLAALLGEQDFPVPSFS
jgi:copper chaperone CopZ